MKISFRLPPFVADFWRGCRVEEKAIFCVAALIVPFCVGFEYSKGRGTPPLPPLFHDAPNAQIQSASPVTKEFLLVHVAGDVRRPGLQKLPKGARVFQALQAAGGATDEKSAQSLNLAAPLVDGQKIVVGQATTVQAVAEQAINGATQKSASSTRSATSPASAAGNAAATTRRSTRKALPAAPIDINRASAAELETLPGVGPALAARIIAARSQKRFSNLGDLDEVSGIGPKKLEAMRPFVRF